jgi:ribosome-associated toxin RatA of RatAB toxin-antitoxin module
MRVRLSIDVQATPEPLFAMSQDYAHRLDWDPFLKEASLVGGADRPGVGVRAWCVARSGFGMETRYLTFRPPSSCAVEMTRGPWFLRSFAGSWRFVSIGSGQTRVEFTYDVVGRPRLLTGLLAWVFRRDTAARLSAFRRAAEPAVEG